MKEKGDEETLLGLKLRLNLKIWENDLPPPRVKYMRWELCFGLRAVRGASTIFGVGNGGSFVRNPRVVELESQHS